MVWGIISMSTPLSRISSGHFTESQVSRLQVMNVDKVIANQGIDIKHYDSAHKKWFTNNYLQAHVRLLQWIHIY